MGSPINKSEISKLVDLACDKMTLPQRRVWEAIKVHPMKWQENTYGAESDGFWVVAIYGSTVVWYNDIEEGFNLSKWTTPGIIDEYWCNQSELQFVVKDKLEGTLPSWICCPPETIS